MKEFEITFRCANGHEQVVLTRGVDRRFVEMQAALLTGDPAIYKYPPGPESQIGHCGICQGKLETRIIERTGLPS